MTRKHAYLLLCILGTVIPYFSFVPWLRDHGFDLSVMVDELFANRISAFFGLDVIVSSVVLWVFVAWEGRRIGVRHLWAPVVGSLTVGVSLGLPLFLYLRESRMESTTRL
jgi:hypothetical protein